MASRATVKGHHQGAANMALMGQVAAQESEQPLERGLSLIERDAVARYAMNGTILSGALAGSYVTQIHERRRNFRGAETGPTGEGIANAHLLEFGVDPHYQPNRGMMHPGHAPFPALTPAAITRREDALREVRAGVARNMMRLVARMRTR